MTNSETVEDFIRMAQDHKMCVDIRGNPGRVMLRDPLIASNPQFQRSVVNLYGSAREIGFHDSVLDKTTFNLGGSNNVFILAVSGISVLGAPTFNIGSLSSDVLRSAEYRQFTGNRNALDEILRDFGQHRVRTYQEREFDVLDPKGLQAKAPELVEKPIEYASRASVSPVEVFTQEQLRNFSLPGIINGALILRLVESAEEPLTFEGSLGSIFRCGDIAYGATNYPTAMHYFIRYLKEIPTSERVWNRVWNVVEKDRASATNWLQDISDVAPFDPDMWLRKGRAADLAQNPSLSFDFYYEALMRRPTLEVWGNLKAAIEASRGPDMGWSRLSQLEQIEPHSPPMWLKRAALAEQLGVERKAIYYYKRALELDPSNEAVLSKLKGLLAKYHPK